MPSKFSAAQIAEAKRIMKEIEEHLPSEYAPRTLEILKKQGYKEYDTEQVYATKNGRSYNLHIARALQIVADEHNQADQEDMDRKGKKYGLEL
jgi:hypothetical protein